MVQRVNQRAQVVVFFGVFIAQIRDRVTKHKPLHLLDRELKEVNKIILNASLLGFISMQTSENCHN